VEQIQFSSERDFLSPSIIFLTPEKMLEAKLSEAGTLKKLLDGMYDASSSTKKHVLCSRLPPAIKELVTDANFECNEEGIVLQAMDNSHVALVSVKFSAPAFKRYRCDRPMPLGVNLTSLTKVLKCAKDDDICTLKAADEADVLNLVYEAKSKPPRIPSHAVSRVASSLFSHFLQTRTG